MSVSFFLSRVKIYKIFDIRDVFLLIRRAFHARREVVQHEMKLYGTVVVAAAEEPRGRLGSSSTHGSAESKTPQDTLAAALLKEI
jgi:hypothetical protein